MISTTARNASLNDAVNLLTEQAARKVDMVVTHGAMSVKGGLLHVAGVEPILTEDGVTLADGIYRPTTIADEGFAAKLQVPIGYLRRMRDGDHTDLLDHNLNYWLEQDPSKVAMVRAFKGDEGEGVMRALLSDKYKRLDNLDITLAVLNGLRDAGIAFTVSGFDVTERRMRFVVEAPDIQVAARELLKGYRSPFTGQTGEDLPFVHAGFAVGNSETGNGSLTVKPRAVVKICNNGLTRDVDLFRAVHLGGRLETGVIQWADDTQDTALSLVTKQVRDTVLTYTSTEYLAAWVTEMEVKAGVPISNPEKAVKVIAKRALFSEEEAQGILAMFINGGQATAGGFMQATTAYSQTIENPERAVEVEEQGLAVLAIAASL